MSRSGCQRRIFAITYCAQSTLGRWRLCKRALVCPCPRRRRGGPVRGRQHGHDQKGERPRPTTPRHLHEERDAAPTNAQTSDHLVNSRPHGIAEAAFVLNALPLSPLQGLINEQDEGDPLREKDPNEQGQQQLTHHPRRPAVAIQDPMVVAEGFQIAQAHDSQHGTDRSNAGRQNRGSLGIAVAAPYLGVP